MINIITGAPGSGKTYLLVDLIVSEYFYYHKKNKVFLRNDKEKKYEIFTNIKGLTLPHKNLDELWLEVPFDKFFSFEYQERIHKKYPHILYILDEVHDYLPPKYSNLEVIKYFSKHRQFGDRVYLCSQDIAMISKSMQLLIELEYRAVKATFSVFGGFTYKIRSKGADFKTKHLKKNPQIYKLYTSFVGDDQKKPFNPLTYIIVLLVLSFVGLGYYFYWRIKPENKKNRSQDSPIQQALPSSTTSFRDEKPKESDLEVSIDMEKIHPVPLTGWVELRESLYMFVDPITEKSIYPHEAPYAVRKINGIYYCLLNLRQFLQYRKTNQVFTTNHE